MELWAGLIGAYMGGLVAALIARALNRAEGTAIAVVVTLGGMLAVVAGWLLLVSVSGYGARINSYHILVITYQNPGRALMMSLGLVVAAALPFLFVARRVESPPLVERGEHTPSATMATLKDRKDQGSGNRIEPTI